MLAPVFKTLPTLRSPRGEPARHRFLIMGLPRSGTTYLMTLLNAHSRVVCLGEQYNPYAVIHENERDDSHEAVVGRDSDPVGHMARFFEQPQPPGVTHAGFKFMIGHNVRVLQQLEQMPDITLIHVWRENRLAQVSSLLRAARDQKWAETKAQAKNAPKAAKKIKANPRQISHRWHEYATFDHLFRGWLAARPNPQFTVEYREMFQPGFKEKLCSRLGLEVDPAMQSPLAKQNANTIAERFEEPGPIRYYFRKIGYGGWLNDEL